MRERHADRGCTATRVVRVVCDWRELRTEYRAKRSEAYQAEMAALGQEPGTLFGSQRVFIPRDPRESDSDTDSDT